jgi:hypothetical protein
MSDSAEQRTPVTTVPEIVQSANGDLGVLNLKYYACLCTRSSDSIHHLLAVAAFAGGGRCNSSRGAVPASEGGSTYQ